LIRHGRNVLCARYQKTRLPSLPFHADPAVSHPYHMSRVYRRHLVPSHPLPIPSKTPEPHEPEPNTHPVSSSLFTPQRHMTCQDKPPALIPLVATAHCRPPLPPPNSCASSASTTDVKVPEFCEDCTKNAWFCSTMSAGSSRRCAFPKLGSSEPAG